MGLVRSRFLGIGDSGLGFGFRVGVLEAQLFSKGAGAWNGGHLAALGTRKMPEFLLQGIRLGLAKTCHPP